ncbi:MAG: 2-phospho-L-lactate guanylyltransferase [Rhodobacteraceae bacterium]|nr:MAG: 2-phospho-L-lactate guanylyltransferase [Paracoccaceae bacterium]
MSAPLSGAWTLTPVKRLAEAKSRLATVLGREARAALQLAMLRDLLFAAAGAGRIAGRAVITADPRVAAVAAACGALVLREPDSDGLDHAVARGAAALHRLGAATAAVIPADAPLTTGAEIARAVGVAEATGATLVAPDRRRDGTNMLVFVTARPPVFAYGPGSFARHAGGHGALELRLDGAAHDIDAPDDLRFLAAAEGAPRSRAVLAAAHRFQETAP